MKANQGQRSKQDRVLRHAAMLFTVLLMCWVPTRAVALEAPVGLREVSALGSFCWRVETADGQDNWAFAFVEKTEDDENSARVSELRIMVFDGNGDPTGTSLETRIPIAACRVQRIGDVDRDGVPDLAFYSITGIVVSSKTCQIIGKLPEDSTIICTLPSFQDNGIKHLLVSAYQNGTFIRAEMRFGEGGWSVQSPYTEVSGSMLQWVGCEEGGSDGAVVIPRRKDAMPYLARLGESGVLTKLRISTRGQLLGSWENRIVTMCGPGGRMVVVAHGGHGEQSRVAAISFSSGEELWDKGTCLYSEADFCRDRFGYDFAAAGDADGDGVGDVLIGAPTFDACSPSLQMISGASGQVIWIQVGGRDKGIGHCVERISDVDGDGIDDFLVGVTSSQKGKAGAALVSGATGYALREIVVR